MGLKLTKTVDENVSIMSFKIDIFQPHRRGWNACNKSGAFLVINFLNFCLLFCLRMVFMRRRNRKSFCLKKTLIPTEEM